MSTGLTNRRRHAWLVAALSAIAAVAACSQTVDRAKEEAAIREADARWLKASQAREAPAEAAVFASDGVAYREHLEPINGPAAFEAYTRKFETDNPKMNVSWSTDAIHVADSGDLAIQTGSYHFTGLGPNGDAEDTGRFVTVWKKENGQWKVAHDIGSPTTPDLSTDAVIGTWELNVGKSRYAPGPGLKSETRTYAVSGQEVKASSRGVGADGKPTAAQWTVVYDGKDRPLTGNPDADMLSLTRLDAHHFEFTQKRAGKVVATGTRVISEDGRTMTVSTKGTDAKGQAIESVEVFDRR